MKAKDLGQLGNATALAAILFLAFGCAGYIIHALSVEGSESTYSTAKASLPAPKDKNGRLFVYLLGGPTLAPVATMIEGSFAIDDAVYAYVLLLRRSS